MNFHSLDYLVFLALVLSGYWALARHRMLRLAVVVVASCLFYMAWQPAYIVLLLTSITLDYTAGLGMSRARSQRTKRAWLLASLCGNLGLLGTFKYYNFFSTATADALSLFGLHVQPAQLHVLLPVGISFYTFESMSYTIDVYRGQLKPTRNFLEFAFFLTFFPHLVAGPDRARAGLLAAARAAAALDARPRSAGPVPDRDRPDQEGRDRRHLALNLVDRVFDDPSAYIGHRDACSALLRATRCRSTATSPATPTSRSGSAQLFGFEAAGELRPPVPVARASAEFWRRWHISLSTWLRDYLYIPLGGNRGAAACARTSTCC